MGNESTVDRISGRGEIIDRDGDRLARVRYTLTVTGTITIVPLPGESAGEKHVAGEIEILERPAETPQDLREIANEGLALHLDDGRKLEIALTDRIPGGYLVEGQGGFK